MTELGHSGAQVLQRYLDGLVGPAFAARVFCGPLPCRLAAAAARVHGELIVWVDLTKPAAIRHAVAMFDHLPNSALLDLEETNLPVQYGIADPGVSARHRSTAL